MFVKRFFSILQGSLYVCIEGGACWNWPRSFVRYHIIFATVPSTCLLCCTLVLGVTASSISVAPAIGLQRRGFTLISTTRHQLSQMDTTIAADNPTTAPSSTGLSTNTIIIIVGTVAGTLLLLVVIMLCVIGCFMHKKAREMEGDQKERKQKKNNPPEYRDRIFRPVDWSNPDGPDGGHDMTEIDEILWQESHSRRGSIAMRNPAYQDDNEDGTTLDDILSNGHLYRLNSETGQNGSGPPRPPKLDMLPPERQLSSKSEASSKHRTSSHSQPPSSPTESAQISILDRRTWGTPDGGISDDIEASRSRPNGRMNTVSGPHNDPAVDFSVFGTGMRGSALQENTLRRSMRSKNQAIVDFYESGYSNSISGRSAASLPMSKMDYQVESDERPSSGWGTGNRLLWQKRNFETSDR